ncbi:DoxX family membrane protein [Flagellimonas sp.]|uniref:DoxX family membrane protein n=1 Tax=Flagellimonas sp. TaxID=2058762 RepID=UPI003B50621E
MESNVQTVKTLLRYTYGLVPIIAGLDKFTNLLADWSQYVSPGLSDMLPFEAGIFMLVVGVIEILAGILVFVKTKIGSLVVMSWLIAIALVLVLGGQFIDVAVRDLVMAMGAFSLAKLYSE